MGYAKESRVNFYGLFIKAGVPEYRQGGWIGPVDMKRWREFHSRERIQTQGPDFMAKSNPMVVDTNLKHTSTDRADLLIIPPILKLTSKCFFCLPASAVATDPFRMSIWRHHVQTLGSQSCILSTSTSLFLFSRYLRMIKGEREAKEAHLYF